MYTVHLITIDNSQKFKFGLPKIFIGQRNIISVKEETTRNVTLYRNFVPFDFPQRISGISIAWRARDISKFSKLSQKNFLPFAQFQTFQKVWLNGNR